MGGFQSEVFVHRDEAATVLLASFECEFRVCGRTVTHFRLLGVTEGTLDQSSS